MKESTSTMSIVMTELKPGWLVSLSTSITGNITYEKEDKENRKTEQGEIITRWETTRTVADPDEAESATKIRSKCRSIISAACSHSNKFGLLCTAEKKADLDRAVETAQQLARAFNQRARLTTVRVNVIAGYIAANDEQAISSLRGEIREMIETMQRGVVELDVESVRDAASRAAAISTLLTPDVSNTVLVAVNAAREAARTIVKAAKSGGATIQDANTIRILRASRLAFLDLDESNETPTPSFVPANTSRPLDLDWDPTIPDTIDSTSIPI